MDTNLATCIEGVAEVIPDAIALQHGPRSVSWEELDSKAACLARAIVAAGASAGAHVALFMPNCPEYVIATLAAMKLRGTPINVNYRFLADELDYIVNNSDAEVLVFDHSLASIVEAARPGLTRVCLFVVVGETADTDARSFDDVIATSHPAPRMQRAGDDTLIIYTGGTTGYPKGVVQEHRSFMAGLVSSACAELGVAVPETVEQLQSTVVEVARRGDTPRALIGSPLMHGTGFTVAVATLLMGGTVVTLPGARFDPHELWRAVDAHGVTWIGIVGDPFARPMNEALKEAEKAGKPYNLASVRVVASSGVVWSPRVKQELLERAKVQLLDTLGSTEAPQLGTSVATSTGDVPSTFQVNDRTRVIDDQGRDVLAGSGEVGHLALGGDIPLGYYKDPERTARTFRMINGERFVVPGDAARVELDGSITLLGRGDACINTGGEKVYPEEVELAMRAHPGVSDCMVVGVPDERWGHRVAAVVTLVEPRPSEEELNAWIRGRLAAYKCPKDVLVVPALKRGAAGKADYKWARQVATGERS